MKRFGNARVVEKLHCFGMGGPLENGRRGHVFWGVVFFDEIFRQSLHLPPTQDASAFLRKMDNFSGDIHGHNEPVVTRGGVGCTWICTCPPGVLSSGL